MTSVEMASMSDVIRIPDAGESVLAAPTAQDIMTTPAIACRDHAFFEEVAEILADRDISGMPVVNRANEVVGVISERDLAHALGGPMVRLALRRPNHPHFTTSIGQLPRAERRVKEIMTSPAITVQIDAPVSEIARLMHLNEVNRLPAMDGPKLVGVVTRGDVLAAVAHLDRREIFLDLDLPPVLLGSEGMDAGSSLYDTGLNLAKTGNRANRGERR